MNFKVNKKLIIFNLSILLAIYFCFDFSYFLYMVERENTYQKQNMSPLRYFTEYTQRYNINYLDKFEEKYITRIKANKELKERFLTNQTSKEQPIVVLGCSYAYGQHLDKDSAFSGQLAKLTNRPIYNLAFIAGSIQHAIYQLKNDFFQKNIKNPKYVIYVYMNDHINRLYNSCGYTILDYIFYKDKNDTLEINKFYSYITRQPIPFVINTTLNLNFENSEIKRSEFLKKHIEELHTLVKKNWKDTKFVVFAYENNYEINSLTPFFKENNIEYLELNTLLNQNNIKYDDSFKLPEEVDRFRHPSAKAWKIITPLLEKQLK